MLDRKTLALWFILQPLLHSTPLAGQFKPFEWAYLPQSPHWGIIEPWLLLACEKLLWTFGSLPLKVWSWREYLSFVFSILLFFKILTGITTYWEIWIGEIFGAGRAIWGKTVVKLSTGSWTSFVSIGSVSETCLVGCQIQFG